MFKNLINYIRDQFEANRSRWSLWFPVAFATGIGIYFLLPVEPGKWLTLGLIECLILLAVLFRYRPKVLYGLMVPACILSGFAYIQIRTIYLSGHQYPAPEGRNYYSGRIVVMDYNSRGNIRLTLTDLQNFDGKPIPGKFRISLRPQPGHLYTGQCVEFVGVLMSRPHSVIPGGYQFDRKQFYQGLSGSGYSESRALPVDCAVSPGFIAGLSAQIDKIRQNIIRRIKKLLPPAEASVTAAIVAGEQGGIKTKLINNYRDSGLAHFLSISGLHMTMIAGLMFFLIRLAVALIPPLALRLDSKKLAAWFAILISVVYLLISGAAIPSQRAFIMTFIVLLGVLTNRRAISMKTIALAAFLVLLVSPEALIGASFQMSFAAVIALIAFYEKFASRLSRFLNGAPDRLLPLWRRTIRIIVAYFLGIMITDLVASLATLPFAVFHFNRIAVYTSLANLSAGPVIGFIIMPFTLLSLILMPLGLESGALKIVGLGIGWVNDITAWVSSLPSAGLPVLSMPLWGFLLIIFGGLWLMLWITRWRWWGIPAIVIGFASISLAERPDVLIDKTAEVVAIKASDGNMVILPGRGNNFVKSVWSGKMAMAQLSARQKRLLRQIAGGKKKLPEWLDLSCNQTVCRYQNRVEIFKTGKIVIDGKEYNPKPGLGAAIYLDTSPARIVTVRDDIGVRLWNLISTP